MSIDPLFSCIVYVCFSGGNIIELEDGNDRKPYIFNNVLAIVKWMKTIKNFLAPHQKPHQNFWRGFINY